MGSLGRTPQPLVGTEDDPGKASLLGIVKVSTERGDLLARGPAEEMV